MYYVYFFFFLPGALSKSDALLLLYSLYNHIPTFEAANTTKNKSNTQHLVCSMKETNNTRTLVVEGEDLPLAAAAAGGGDMDSVLAREMNKLSVEERERVYQDIHCIPIEEDESPDTVSQAFDDMEANLKKIPRKMAYELARSLSSDYVMNHRFRLAFLHARSFDAAAAAVLLVDFFELKLTLFGVEKLTRDIKLCDLDDDTHVFLESGLCQLFPERDRAGRMIICAIPPLKRHQREESMVRCLLMSSELVVVPCS